MYCEEIIGCLKMSDAVSESSKKIQLSSGGSQAHQFYYFPFKAPLNTQKIEQFLVNGEHSDVNIYVNGHGLVTHAHKLILSLWSMTFDKVQFSSHAVFLYVFITLKYSYFSNMLHI